MSSVVRSTGTKPGCGNCVLRSSGICQVLIDSGLEAARPTAAPIRQSAVTANSGRTIFRRHDPLDRIPVLCDGWAAVVASLSNGRRQILSFVLPGEFTSYAALFDDRHRQPVISITASSCRCFQAAELKHVLFSDAGAIGRIGAAIVAEKQRADRLMVDVGCRSATGRIACLILDLRDRLMERNLVQDESFEFPLRQTDIADATGLTPVHVNRVLGELRREGLIQIADRSIRILSLDSLQSMAEQ